MHNTQKSLANIFVYKAFFCVLRCAPYGTRTCDLYHVKVTL